MLQTNRHRVHRGVREHRGVKRLRVTIPSPPCREGINATLFSLPHSLSKKQKFIAKQFHNCFAISLFDSKRRR